MNGDKETQWIAALSRLDDAERHNVIWRYRMAHRRADPGMTGQRWVQFKELSPHEQTRWIVYARQRAHTNPPVG